MTHIRQSKFGFPSPVPKGSGTSILVIDPTWGFHGGILPTAASPNYCVPTSVYATTSSSTVNTTYGFSSTPLNWVPDRNAQWIRPRNGTATYASNPSLSTSVIGGKEVYDIAGLPTAFAISSSRTILYQNATSASWSSLSYVGSDTPACSAYAYIGCAQAYDNAQNKNIFVFTNGSNLPKYATITQSTQSYSDFSGIYSLASRAMDVTNFDSRLVWFNVSTSSLSYPQRVLWSTRGQSTDYTLANGAGFQDLWDMAGSGQRIIDDGDRVVLFSDQQIWAGRKRADAYVFDFYAVRRDLGCPYPKTITKTPYGIVFLSRDNEVYLLNGDTLTALGPRRGSILAESKYPSRIKNWMDTFVSGYKTAWATYDQRNDQLQLYINIPFYNLLFPEYSLIYAFENDSWWLQDYTSFSANAGHEGLAFGFPASIGQNASQNAYTVYRERMLLFGSNGGAYYSSDDLESDAGAVGSTKTCRWQSGNLALPGVDLTRISEVWIEYDLPDNMNGSSDYGLGEIPFTLNVYADFGMQTIPSYETKATTFSEEFKYFKFVPVDAVGSAPNLSITIADSGFNQIRIGRIFVFREPAGPLTGRVGYYGEAPSGTQ